MSASSVRDDAPPTARLELPEFRRPFARWLGFDVRTGILLLVILGAVRVALVLQANVSGSYQAVSVVFAAMALLPWMILTRTGRRAIGILAPSRWRWMLPAVVAGALTCALVFMLFLALWGESLHNAFVYIGNTYSAVPEGLDAGDRAIYFAIFAVIGLTFSPIGEEMVYRGIAQVSFARRVGESKAALIDAGAFALVHLAHFGVVFVAGVWAFYPFPALVWFGAMFAASLVFHIARRMTGSIWGAVASHAGFNLAMTIVIFYAIDLF